MATGIREKTTNVGGVIKRIWYAMTGTTQGAELASLDDTGKFKCVSEQVSGLAGAGNRMVVADSIGNLSNLGITVFDTTKNMGSNTTAWTDLTNGVLGNGIYDFYVDFWYVGTFHFKEKFTICIAKDPVEILSYGIMSNNSKISSVTTGTGADFGKINLTLLVTAAIASVRYIKWA